MRRSIRFLATTRILIPLSIVLGFAMLTGASVLKVMPAVASANQQPPPVLVSPRLDRLSPAQALALTAPATMGATVQTDRLDYYPGENVIITGAGWQSGEVVQLLIHEEPPLDPDLALYTSADADGMILNNEFYTDWHDNGVTFTLTATGLNSQLTAQTTFTDSAANLDQWANLPTGSWVNGNLGASKSSYFEGNSIPYRITMSGLPLAPTSHTITIEWDTTKSGKHALDYLTSFLQPNPIFGDQPNPCLGVTDCSLAVFSTWPIPADSQVTGAPVTPIPGNFTLYGGTITGVSAYSYPNGMGFAGDKTARISITFTADVANPVLAWGGHISTRLDWGALNSAVAIPGSPYHTRLIDLDGTGGNQDRSLSSEAVIFPGQITIVKSADPEGSKVFEFTNSPALPLGGSSVTSFTLKDDGTTANNTKVFTPVVSFSPPDYTVTETVPSDWKLDHITCTVDQDPVSGTTASGSGSTATISLKEGAYVTCTFFDIGTRLTVTKTVVPSTDAGKFNLQIDGSTEGTGADVGNGGTTGAIAVTAGAHTVGETAGTSTTLSDYSMVIGGDCDSTGHVTLAAGDSKTCTITNTRKTHKVKLIKTLSPTSDPGKFDLTAAGTTATNQGNNGYAENTSVAVGTTNVTVSEIANAASGTSLANYTSSLSCTGVTATGTTSASFTMPDNDVTCTVTNTRKTHKVTLTKNLSPTNDSGKFNLTAAGTTVNDQGNGGSAQNTSVATGTTGVTVSEAAGTGTDLANYTSSLSCDNGATGTTSASFTMPDADVACTVTNTRKTHTVKLIKSLSPADDPGKFNLTAAGTTVNDQGNNGFAQNTSVAVGTTGVSVSELAGTGTSLANYTSSLSCVGVTATGTTSGSFTMPDNDVTCTVTNTRKTHKVKLIKSLSPAADTGKFDLTAAGTTATNQGNNGFAENTSVAVGTTNVTVSEIANVASGTSLANYTSVLGCEGVTASGTTSASFTMPDNDVTCTVTNTRKTHTVKLIKSLVPTDDPGKFNLTAAGTTANDQVNGGFAQNTGVAVGTTGVSVSELAGTGTSLANYTSSLSCVGVTATGTTSASFTMPDNDVTCTVTNTRKTHTVKLIKSLVPSNDTGKFNLTAAGTTATDQGNGGFAQNTSVAVGTTNVGVSEVAGTGTDLAHYTSSLSCVGVTATGTTSASFTMPDDDVTCTVTNTRKTHTVSLTKALVPTNDPGKFNLTAAGTTVNDQGNGGSAQNTSVATGTTGVTVSEAAGTGTDLANYTSSLSCDNGASGTTSASFTMPDADVACTVTNTRKTHKVTLTKALVPTDDPGLFNLTAAGTTANNQGNGGSAQNTNVAAGTTGVSVSEAAGTGTDLANYTSVLSCTGVTATGTTSASFTMPDNDVNCTVTNTRKIYKVTLTKALVPTNDPGKFNLTAAGTTVNDQGNGGSAQNTNVAAGTTGVSVSEAAGTGTDLANYTSVLGCTGVTATGTTSASFTMPANDVNCTVTNTRRIHKVTLTKALVPSSDPGVFNLTAAGTTVNNQGNGGSAQNTNVAAGTTGVSVSEAAGTGTNLSNYTSSLSCDNGVTGTTSASFTMPDADVACTVTNTRKTHIVTLLKSLVPDTDTGLFDLTAAGITASGQGNGGSAQNTAVPVSTSVSVSEIANSASGTSLANYISSLSCVGVTATGTTSASFTMPDNDVTCTVTNTRYGAGEVIKTVSGNPPSGTDSFTFQLRSGASTTQAGTTLESGTADVNNGGTIDFTTKLTPGKTYQLCEAVMPGWTTTLGPPFYAVFNPSGDNSIVCTDFTVAAGETKSFAINNLPPPGGLGRTIGFWKNWASCSGSNGGQDPILDETLALAGGHIPIGDLDVDSCLDAVRILNKSRIDTGKKMASDPAFNLAAQLMAAKLNVAAGAGICGTATTAINNAQALLDAVNFDGKGHGNMTKAQVDQANTLATQLDQYNNNTLCQ